MSYAMRFILTVRPSDAWDGIRPEWPDHFSAPPMAELLDPCGAIASWYRCEEHMRELSARWPDVVLVLELHNVEEQGLYPPERWYFKAGKVQKTTAEYKWPEHEPEKAE